MADGFELKLTGLTEVTATIAGLPKKVRANLVTEMGSAVDLVVRQAKANVERLFHNPSRMTDTISGRVEVGSYEVKGFVEARGLPYLRIHEYGGTVLTPALPKVLHILQKVMKFESSAGETVFTSHTRAHPTTIPERSYLRAALDEKRGEILASFLDVTK